jgi:hypothetical protein
MTRRVKITGDLFHGQIPDGAVYVGRQAPGLRRSPYLSRPQALRDDSPRQSTRAPVLKTLRRLRDVRGYYNFPSTR